MNGIVRRRKQEKAEWKASCPSVEELLCLQLSGYSSRQIVGMGIEGNARRILDRQAKAGVITVPYYADNYPWHFNNLCNDAPALIHVSGDLGLLNRDDTVAVIGARGADAEGLDVAYRFAGIGVRYGCPSGLSRCGGADCRRRCLGTGHHSS